MAIDTAELLRPACYPHPVREVEMVQTHISIVCLAGERVYKLKKPVTLPFLDFGTPALRRTSSRPVAEYPFSDRATTPARIRASRLVPKAGSTRGGRPLLRGRTGMADSDVMI